MSDKDYAPLDDEIKDGVTEESLGQDGPTMAEDGIGGTEDVAEETPSDDEAIRQDDSPLPPVGDDAAEERPMADDTADDDPSGDDNPSGDDDAVHQDDETTDGSEGEEQPTSGETDADPDDASGDEEGTQEKPANDRENEDGRPEHEPEPLRDDPSETKENEPTKVAGFIKTPVAIGIALACAIGGGAIGYLAGNPSPAATDMSGKTELAETELDTVVGQVTFDGKSIPITAKQVIMLNGSLTEETQRYPSADAVLATARSIVMEADAEKRGITVDDAKLAEFMTEMLGSNDYKTVSEQYQIDEESLKALVRSSYISQEVRKQVVGDSEPKMPDAPAVPDEGKEDVTTSEYFSYITEAAGDAWDAEKGTWADETSDFAVTLGSSKTFDPKKKTASYDDALGAYQVLGSKYSVEISSYDTLWNDYLSGLLSGSQVSVYSLLS